MLVFLEDSGPLCKYYGTCTKCNKENVLIVVTEKMCNENINLCEECNTFNSESEPKPKPKPKSQRKCKQSAK